MLYNLPSVGLISTHNENGKIDHQPGQDEKVHFVGN